MAALAAMNSDVSAQAPMPAPVYGGACLNDFRCLRAPAPAGADACTYDPRRVAPGPMNSSVSGRLRLQAPTPALVNGGACLNDFQCFRAPAPCLHLRAGVPALREVAPGPMSSTVSGRLGLQAPTPALTSGGAYPTRAGACLYEFLCFGVPAPAGDDACAYERRRLPL